jgi:hypothetical protein
MNSIRDWIARRSVIELFVIFGGFFGVWMWLAGPAIGLPIGMLGAAIAGVLFGVLVSAVTLWDRRRSGGKARNVEINSAIQSGDLPGLIDPTTWMADLDRRLVDLRTSRVITPVTFGFVVLSQQFLGLVGPRPSGCRFSRQHSPPHPADQRVG